MILDYAEKTGKYLIKVPRDPELIQSLIVEHGLNFWTGSPVDTAVLWTDNAYAALTYVDHATPAASRQLAHMVPQLEASQSLGMARRCATPDGMDLFPYQKAGVDYVLNRTHSLIGDEPGLGKTPMAIVTANEMRAKKILIICPANIRLQWAKQVRAWSTMEGRYIVYPILKSGDGVHPRAEWTIVSYDLLRSPEILRALRASGFDFLILDEAHYLKTPTSLRTKCVFGPEGLSTEVGSILALTGTPLPNRPRECYTLASNLHWDAIDYMSEKDFDARFNPYEVREGKRGRYTIEKKGRLYELQNRLRVNFMVRRKKRDVLDQLPDIRYDIIHVEETAPVRKALEAEKMLDIDPEDLKGCDGATLGHVSTVRKMMGIAKAPLVADYVAGVIEGGEDKIVLFGWHIEVLNILQEKLGKYGLVRVDGSTSALRRQLAVDTFVKDPAVKVFLGNLQSVGVGVDGLQTVCNRGVFAESSWVPADNDQGVGRLERIGQKCGILIEFLVAPGSFDEKVLGSALRKLQGIHSSLDEKI